LKLPLFQAPSVHRFSNMFYLFFMNVPYSCNHYCKCFMFFPAVNNKDRWTLTMMLHCY